MGCDIHLFVEAREAPGQPWHLAYPERKCSWCVGLGKRETSASINRKRLALAQLVKLTSTDRATPEGVAVDLVGYVFDKNGDAKEVMPPDGFVLEYEDCYWCKGTGKEVGFHDRNYDVFAILANVRNALGQGAGVRTGSGFDPIALPKGVPEDLSDEVQGYLADSHREQREDESEEEYARWEAEREEKQDEVYAKWHTSDLGDHSESWLTLKEILDYDVRRPDRVTRHDGVVDVMSYLIWVAKGKEGWPPQMASGVGGASVIQVTEAQFLQWRETHKELEGAMAELLSIEDRHAALETYQRLMTGGGAPNYIEIEFFRPYIDSVGPFFDEFVPSLQALGKDPENVRIVFGFDS